MKPLALKMNLESFVLAFLAKINKMHDLAWFMNLLVAL